MKCPHCKTEDLKPTLIEEYLASMGCDRCHGSLVALLHYRHWAETQKPTRADPGADAANPPARVAEMPDATDTTSAIACPKCSRLMLKYKISGAVANRVDVCSSCDEAWLDGGEWQLLEALELDHCMPSIFTDEWQRRILREAVGDTRRETLKREIGADALVRVEEFKVWLAGSGHKPQILTYLYRNEPVDRGRN
ncbi:MAG TPA: hypothetical protein VFR59_05670 [Steroidobacteraceae bacterium]|nr:hypothetical protein [Steroidobacteraceae bacterium]